VARTRQVFAQYGDSRSESGPQYNDMKAAKLSLDGVSMRKGANLAYTPAVNVILHAREARCHFPVNLLADLLNCWQPRSLAQWE